LPEAASLSIFAKRNWDCREVAKGLIGVLDAEYQSLRLGNFVALENKWRTRFQLLGKRVQLETTAGSQLGILVDMSFDSLQLRQPDELLIQLVPECVQQIHEVPD
jgi:hypothetical protein